ncbi:DUF4363 family protein [Cytobacillus sp. Sa5YUA1]|uniref:DUF4363 family protein n=2 Tax=Cytobacillus stercorigallinarum TaxID=2762240 RepID=A0ABR8QQF9_9BACI|nr:DUF4363 family protein [Cytobacillus stercorigallinarum]
MKEFILYKLIPFLILAIFIFTMKSGDFLKQPLVDGDDVIGMLSLVEQSIQEGDWKSAKKQINQAKEGFLTVQKRVQFSVEKNELNQIGTSLNRAIGFIDVHDQGGAKAEIEEIKFAWEGLGK